MRHLVAIRKPLMRLSSTPLYFDEFAGTKLTKLAELLQHETAGYSVLCLQETTNATTPCLCPSEPTVGMEV
eukprot:5142995-Amphidinium_carterae.2